MDMQFLLRNKCKAKERYGIADVSVVGSANAHWTQPIFAMLLTEIFTVAVATEENLALKVLDLVLELER